MTAVAVVTLALGFAVLMVELLPLLVVLEVEVALVLLGLVLVSLGAEGGGFGLSVLARLTTGSFW